MDEIGFGSGKSRPEQAAAWEDAAVCERQDPWG